MAGKQYPQITVEQYIDGLEPERQRAVESVREVINSKLQPGFEETIQYGMITWVVPHSLYPAGYHCNPTDALPFTALASQKHTVNWYAAFAGKEDLRQWFIDEYAKTGLKLDMGQSCIRFKKLDQIPLEIIGQVVSQISVDEFVSFYESNVKK